MRILCCLNRDLASNIALNLLLPALARHEVRVGLTERVGAAAGASPEPVERQELRAAEQTLPNEIFFPLLERAALADDGARYLTFAEIERHRGIPLAALANPNAAAGLEMLTAFNPDLIVTIRYGAILEQPAISVPRLGVLNLHSGKLPSYRGVLATFRALLNGDAEIGCTLHYISDGTIDTGDIVNVATVPARRDRSLLWHILALYPPGVALLSRAIENLAAGIPPQRTPQPLNSGAYYSYPAADDWAGFARLGWRVTHPGDLLDAFKLYCPTA
jgi:methionyl-tRNA formyltransferase